MGNGLTSTCCRGQWDRYWKQLQKTSGIRRDLISHTGGIKKNVLALLAQTFKIKVSGFSIFSSKEPTY